MEKPRINIEDIAEENLCIIAVSSEGDADTTYVHQLYTPDMTNPEDRFVPLVSLIDTAAPDSWMSLIIATPTNIDNLRHQIVFPNVYLSEFTKFQEHDVLIYLMHQFACVKDYNNHLDETDEDADIDEYRDMAFAYQKTLLHFGTERVLEYIESNHDPIFEIPLKVLKIKAETSKFYEGNPEIDTVDILTGESMRSIRMEITI